LFIAPSLGHACVGLTLQIMFTFQASSDDEVPLIMQSKPVPCGPERACSTEYFDLPGLNSSGVATTTLNEVM